MLKRMIMLLSVIGLISGCSSVATMLGVDSNTINQQSSLAYQETISGERSKIDTKSQTSKRIQTVFNKLRPYADAENKTGVPFEWKLTVIRSNTVNAWAMPGGKMAFYTGIVERLKLTDAEIAAVMGHEMQHALQEHGKQQIGQEKGMQLATNIGCAVADSSVCRNRELIGAIQQIGITLPFSRSHELEADQKGMMLMAKAGYDPRAAITMQQKLSGGKSSGFAIMSTHPSGPDRVKRLHENLVEADKIYQQSKRK